MTATSPDYRTTSPGPFGPSTRIGDPWTRRGFLGVLSAASLGAVTGCDLPSGATRQDFTGSQPKPGATPTGLSSTTSPYTPTAPLSLNATSELSEDYFLFQTHPIDPDKDSVIAYSRADGEVEAILLQDGAVKQIYRDDTQPGGWNLYQFPDAVAGVNDLVAGVSQTVNVDGKVVGKPILKVFYRTSANPDTLHVATQAAGGGQSFSTSTVPWNRSCGPLQLTVSYDGTLLAAAMVPSSSATATDARLYYVSDCAAKPSFGYLTGFNYRAVVAKTPLPANWSATVASPWALSSGQQLILSLPSGSYAPVVVGKLTINPPSVTMWIAQLGNGPVNGAVMTTVALARSMPPVPPGVTPASYSVELAGTFASNNTPSLLMRTVEGSANSWTHRLWMVSIDDGHNSWTWTELTLPTEVRDDVVVTLSTATRPVPTTEKVSNKETAAKSFVDVFVLVDDTLSVIRQAPQADANLDYTKPAFCPAIPLETDVSLMTGQAGQSTGNELLMVGADGILESLVKDPDTGHWIDNPVHLPAGDVEQVSTYRVLLTVTDDWNMPLTGQQLQLSASSSIAALVNGGTTTLGADPSPVVTDAHGQVVVALIADGLSAPTLTVTGSQLPTTTVSPSGAVNSFLQGESTLNYLPPLTADTLSRATTPDGTVVAPGASNSADAKDAVTNMSLAAKQAVSANVSGTRRSSTLQRRDGQLTGTSKADLAGILSDINKWSHDALHAIKKGAVVVSKVAYDAASKVFTLAADFVNWADNVVQIVVHSIEDAAHVVHAALAKLGAAIKHAIAWIRAEVIGTFTDAAALSKQYDDWLAKAANFVGDQAAAERNAVDAWLDNKQAALKASLVSLAHRYSPNTTLDGIASSGPAGLGRSRRSTHRKPKPPVGVPRPVGADQDDQDAPHGDWLWHKVKNDILGAGLTLPTITGLAEAYQKFETGGAQAVKDFTAAFKDFMTFLRTTVTHPSKAGTLGVQALLLAVSDLLDGAFALARAVVDALFDVLTDVMRAVPTILSTPLSATPLVGKLFALVGLGKLSFGRLICTLFSFPAVVAHKISHHGQGRPFGDASLSRGRGRVSAPGDDEDEMLRTCAGIAIGTWTVFDVSSAAMIAFKGEPDGFFTLVDIAAPIIVGFLTVPSTKGGEPYLSPPVSGDNSSQLLFGSWLLTLLPSALVALNHYLDTSKNSGPETEGGFLFLTSGCGALSLITGCLGISTSDDPQAADYADVILNSLPNIAIPGIEREMVEATEGISAVVTAAVMTTAGLSGAGVHIFA